MKTTFAPFAFVCLISLLPPFECHAGGQPSAVIIAPAPEGVSVSRDYSVKVNGKAAPVYLAPVWTPGYGRSFGGAYSFCTFDFAGTAEIEILTAKPLDRVRIRPESRAIKGQVSDGKLQFTLEKACQLAIEPDAKNGPLLLFANALEEAPPNPNAPGVKAFGPGLHKAGKIELKSGETLYLAAGAVVQGGVRAEGQNIRICGRGILDGGSWERKKGPLSGLLHLWTCTNVFVEGITLKDSWEWTFIVTASRQVDIRNVKICSARCENNDGLDICNSSQVTIRDCFIRTDDDCIAPKGKGEWLRPPPQPPVEDLTVERCVLWTDRAHIWRLGCESRASAMRRLLFRDIDVLHYSDNPAILVQPAEDMPMEQVRFENIRIHQEQQRNFILIDPSATGWASKQTPGLLRDVILKDVSLSGQAGATPGSIIIRSPAAGQPIEKILFDHVTRHGQAIHATSPGVQVVGQVNGLEFR